MSPDPGCARGRRPGHRRRRAAAQRRCPRARAAWRRARRDPRCGSPRTVPSCPRCASAASRSSPLPSHRKRSFADQDRRRRVRAILEPAGHRRRADAPPLRATSSARSRPTTPDSRRSPRLHQSARGLRRFEGAREFVESSVVRRHATRDGRGGRGRSPKPTAVGSGGVPIDVVPNPVSAPEPSLPDVTRRCAPRCSARLPGPLLLAVGRLEAVKGSTISSPRWRRSSHTNRVQCSRSPATAACETAARATRPPARYRADTCASARRRDPTSGRCSRVADLFVMSSRSEGLPFALLEAMVAGVPVVATRVGDVPRTLGSAGLLVSPGDPTALAAALTQALSSVGVAGRAVGDPAAARELPLQRIALGRARWCACIAPRSLLGGPEP